MVATVAAGTTAQYYLSLTNYYTGSGEPRGQWVKVGFDTGFESSSLIDNVDFERLHAGLDRSGGFLLSNRGGREDHTGGYDVTFSAPKTVSARWGLSGEAFRAKIERAQARAVEYALDVLERNAAFCRSGKNGVRREKVRLTAAAFQTWRCETCRAHRRRSLRRS